MKAMPGVNERLEEVNSVLTAAMVVRISEMLLANIDCQGFDTLNDGGL